MKAAKVCDGVGSAKRVRRTCGSRGSVFEFNHSSSCPTGQASSLLRPSKTSVKKWESLAPRTGPAAFREAACIYKDPRPASALPSLLVYRASEVTRCKYSLRFFDELESPKKNDGAESYTRKGKRNHSKEQR